MDDEHAVIEDGLTTDSLVVDNWSAKLRNGAEVEIVTLNGEDVVNNTEDTSEETEESQEQATDAVSYTHLFRYSLGEYPFCLWKSRLK